jgi:hypothetical protein
MKNTKLLIAVLLVVIVGVFSFQLFIPKAQPIIVDSSDAILNSKDDLIVKTSEKSIEDISGVIIDEAKKLELLKVDRYNDPQMTWYSDDGYRIIIPASMYMRISQNAYWDTSDYSTRQAMKPELSSRVDLLVAKSIEIFKGAGYVVDNKNGSTFEMIIQPQVPEGYQKIEPVSSVGFVSFNGDLLCSVAKSSTEVTADTSCATREDFDKNYQEQVVFLKAADILPWTTYHLPALEIQGNFASSNRLGGIGKQRLVFAKLNGVWTKISEVNRTHSCSVMEKYKVPQSIYDTCE